MSGPTYCIHYSTYHPAVEMEPAITRLNGGGDTSTILNLSIEGSTGCGISHLHIMKFIWGSFFLFVRDVLPLVSSVLLMF